jgi:hypothetical protein
LAEVAAVAQKRREGKCIEGHRFDKYFQEKDDTKGKEKIVREGLLNKVELEGPVRSKVDSLIRKKNKKAEADNSKKEQSLN